MCSGLDESVGDKNHQLRRLERSFDCYLQALKNRIARSKVLVMHE